MENSLNKFTFNDEEIKKQKSIDLSLRNAEWEKLKKALSLKLGEKSAEELISAMKEMYALFDEDIIDWLASLYDNKSGGWYYSESGRDTDGYGPDVESTYQAMQYLYCTGAVDEISSKRDDGELHDIFPEELCNKMVYWIKGLQDRDTGYLYHPQWGKELTDTLVARRGRDLKFGILLLKRLSAKPTYDTPLGDIGDGILPGGEPINTCREQLCDVNKKNERIITEHLRDLESFQRYLSSLPIETSPYAVGNLMESQVDQIVMRDKELMKEGAGYSLCDTLKEFFDRHQNPKTGLWTPDDTVTYEGVNGLLKIGSTYDRMERQIPNPTRALNYAKLGIYLDYPDTVCYVLNPWYAISVLSSNIIKFLDESAKDQADEFKKSLLSQYAELVRTTTAHMRLFKKENGPFSFRQKATMANNQGAPSAVPGTNEGDTNATNCMRGCIDHVKNILSSVIGESCPRIYGTADYMRFMNRILK